MESLANLRQMQKAILPAFAFSIEMEETHLQPLNPANPPGRLLPFNWFYAPAFAEVTEKGHLYF